MTAAGRPGSHGFLHPVAGAVSSAFGMRLHPLRKIWNLHDGTDFAAGCGTAIRAPYAGVVTKAFFNSAYGNPLSLSHGSVDGVRVETCLQPRRALSGSAGSAGQSRAGDRRRRKHRTLDGLPFTPDGVAQWTAQQPDELAVTQLRASANRAPPCGGGASRRVVLSASDDDVGGFQARCASSSNYDPCVSQARG